VGQVREVYHRLKSNFAKVFAYTGSVPTYPSGIWTYAIASDGNLAGIVRSLPAGLRYVDEDYIRSLYLPPFIRDQLSRM
jgi:spermidine synthase